MLRSRDSSESVKALRKPSVEAELMAAPPAQDEQPQLLMPKPPGFHICCLWVNKKTPRWGTMIFWVLTFPNSPNQGLLRRGPRIFFRPQKKPSHNLSLRPSYVPGPTVWQLSGAQAFSQFTLPPHGDDLRCRWLGMMLTTPNTRNHISFPVAMHHVAVPTKIYATLWGKVKLSEAPSNFKRPQLQNLAFGRVKPPP